MGILLKRSEDGEVYQDAYSEAQRIIRISDEVKISVDVVEKKQVLQKNQNIEIAKKYDTLTVLRDGRPGLGLINWKRNSLMKKTKSKVLFVPISFFLPKSLLLP